jgi:hypothetical protein
MAGPPQTGGTASTAKANAGNGKRPGSTLLAPLEPLPRRDPSLVPFLSIQLLILAFFIILTSHATLNADKARAVTESVQRQFSGNQESVPEGPQGGALEPEARTVLQKVMVTFQGLVPLDRNVRNLSALEQIIRLPVELFYAADSADIIASRRSLFDEVMRAIDLRPAGWGYEIEILVQGDPPSSLTLDRAANLAAALAQDGQAQANVAVAVGTGDPAWLVLLLRLRPQQTTPVGGAAEELAP